MKAKTYYVAEIDERLTAEELASLLLSNQRPFDVMMMIVMDTAENYEMWGMMNI